MSAGRAVAVRMVGGRSGELQVTVRVGVTVGKGVDQDQDPPDQGAESLAQGQALDLNPDLAQDQDPDQSLVQDLKVGQNQDPVQENLVPEPDQAQLNPSLVLLLVQDQGLGQAPEHALAQAPEHALAQGRELDQDQLDQEQGLVLLNQVPDQARDHLNVQDPGLPSHGQPLQPGLSERRM